MAEKTNTPSGANKYSIYAQRSVEGSQVDWGKIAGDLTKGAEVIRDERQGRKDAIDKEVQNSIEQLSKIPETGTQDASSLLINGSAMSVQAIQTNADLIRRGIRKPKDGLLFMQEQKNGYANLSKGVQAWDKWAVTAKTRIQEGVASGQEIYNNLSVEALGNLSNKELLSNPINGKLELVTMIYNPNTELYDIMPDYDKNPENFQNPNIIPNIMKNQENKIDVNTMAKKQTAVIADIVQTYVDGPKYNVLDGGGKLSSISDFRQLGNFGTKEDGTAVTYKDWKTDQINAMVGGVNDTKNQKAGQVLYNSGKYFYASSLSQFETLHPTINKKYWLNSSNATGVPITTLNADQMKAARGLADTAIESQVKHIEKVAAAAKGGQQENQDTANTTRIKEEEDAMKAYFSDINNIITAPAKEGEAVAQDRLTDMNQQFLDSQNATDRSTKINSIKRGANEIIINKTVRGVNKPVTVDKFFRDSETGELDLTQPLESKEIARKIYRELIPRSAVKKMSFDDFYDAAIKNGMDFTPKMIRSKDNPGPDDKPNMIPNKAYGGDESFGTKTEIEKINNYSSDNFTDLEETRSMALEFKGIVDENGNSNYSNNFKDAAPVVKKAFSQGLRQLEKVYGSSLDVKIGFNDVFGGDNEITYSYKDPVTGKTVSDKFIYNDDNTKLQSEVDSKINEIIDAYNAKQASGENKPVGSGASGKVDAFGNPV